MIVHIFPGDFEYLTIQIVKSIYTKSVHKHFFLIPTFKEANKKKYELELKDLPKNTYFIFDENYGSRVFKLVAFLLGHRKEKLLQEAAIARALFKHRKNTIISHFYIKSYCILPFFRNYIWICWGNIPKFNSTNNILKKRKNWIFKKYIYSRLSNIVTLMNADRDILINDFNCKKNNVKILNYNLNNYEELFSIEKKQINNNITKKILLGNSSNNLDYYYQAISSLSQFKDEYTLYCMLSYGKASEDEIKNYIKSAKLVFEDKFIPVRSFFSHKDYIYWLMQFDIYVSNSLTQTGLGVIYFMLYLGKKVFISGNNFKWCEYNELIVFPFDKLKDGIVDNLEPLNKIEKKHNKEKIAEMLDTNALNKNWDNFYNSLLF